MIIYFLRHANAGQRRKNPTQDEKRPLDKEGIEQCQVIGRALTAINAQVDIIISSPLKRATQTAALVGNEIGYDSKIAIEPALRPEGRYEAFRQLLEKYLKYENIMLVGHNPNLSEFLSLLISGDSVDRAIELKKGAVTRVEFNRRASKLHWCITPRIVREVYASAIESSRPKTARK